MTQSKKYEGFALELDVSRKIARQLERLPVEGRERIYHFVVGALGRGEDLSKIQKLPHSVSAAANSPLAREVDGQVNFLGLEPAMPPLSFAK